MIVLSLFPITTGSSQNINTDTAKKIEYEHKRQELDSIILQKKISLDLLEYQLSKDSLPEK